MNADYRREEKESCSIPCNLCGSASIRTLSLKDRNRKYLRTIICKKCGLIWIDPRSSGKEIRKFYAEEYRREYKGADKPKLKHLYRDVDKAVRRYHYLKDIIRKDDLILDVGSGTGVFVYTLCSLGFNACGIEPDEGYAKYSVEELNVPVRIVFVQDVKSDSSFNIITIHHVLEHTENPCEILKKAWTLLKENGFLVIEVPNAEDIQQDPYNRYHKAHLYTFNPETLEGLGRKAGFQVYKALTAPYGRNITTIFKKEGNPGKISGEITGNYEKITKTLNKYNTRRHFRTITPYKFFFTNTLKTVWEQIEIRKYRGGKEMVDSVLKKELKSAATVTGSP
ncbi:MAG: class I SAM-dependent methyltransferase [Candidatus Omnitrophota bacterium]|nr:class I SAM-dependent methyltransferase [Candidatus Omnitrophota bacterium]